MGAGETAFACARERAVSRWGFLGVFIRVRFATGGSGLACRAATVSARWSSAKRKRMLGLWAAATAPVANEDRRRERGRVGGRDVVNDYFAFFFGVAAEFTG